MGFPKKGISKRGINYIKTGDFLLILINSEPDKGERPTVIARTFILQNENFSCDKILYWYRDICPWHIDHFGMALIGGDVFYKVQQISLFFFLFISVFLCLFTNVYFFFLFLSFFYIFLYGSFKSRVDHFCSLFLSLSLSLSAFTHR